LLQLGDCRTLPALVGRREAVARDVRMPFQKMMNEVFQRARAEAVNDANLRQRGEIGFVEKAVNFVFSVGGRAPDEIEFGV
jgi:hypothetical protein